MRLAAAPASAGCSALTSETETIRGQLRVDSERPHPGREPKVSHHVTTRLAPLPVRNQGCARTEPI